MTKLSMIGRRVSRDAHVAGIALPDQHEYSFIRRVSTDHRWLR
jgi:hypothetical protein